MNMYAVPNPGIPGCPPGLEYLIQVSTGKISRFIYHVHYFVTLVDVICIFISRNATTSLFSTCFLDYCYIIVIKICMHCYSVHLVYRL